MIHITSHNSVPTSRFHDQPRGFRPFLPAYIEQLRTWIVEFMSTKLGEKTAEQIEIAGQLPANAVSPFANSEKNEKRLAGKKQDEVETH